MSKASVATANDKAIAKAAKAAAKATANNGTTPKAKSSFTPMQVLETIQVSPKSLTLVPKFRGRSAPVAAEDVLAMAESLYARQDQPIQVRKGANGILEVIFGNTRTAAGLLIVEGFKVPTGKDSKTGELKFKTFPPIPDFTLRAEVVDCDDEEATLRNITENISRVATTSIDDAKNQEMLREEFKMSDAAITRLYGYQHQASVTGLKKLLSLPEEVQNKIHTGNMTKQGGFVLVDWCRKKAHVDIDNKCDPTVCEKIIAGSKNMADVGGIGTADIQEAIKAFEKEAAAPATTTVDPGALGGTEPAVGTPGNPMVEDGASGTGSTPAAATPPATVFPKTLKDIKDMLTEFAGLPDQPPKMSEFCTITLNYLKGETDKAAYFEWLSEVFAAE